MVDLTGKSYSTLLCNDDTIELVFGPWQFLTVRIVPHPLIEDDEEEEEREDELAEKLQKFFEPEKQQNEGPKTPKHSVSPL